MGKVKDIDEVKKWQKIMEMQQASGVNKSAWCREQGINLKTFYYWQKKLGSISTEKPQNFVEAVITEPVSASSKIQLYVGNIRIDVFDGVNAELLAKTIRAINAAC